MEFIHRQIKPVKSVGEILKASRKKKNLSLEEAEEETKVRAKYLQTLEDDRFEDLPEPVYAVGFLAKYAELLELNKEDLVRQFNRETGKNDFAAKLMVERKINEPLIFITPKFLIILGIILAIVGIIGYISYSVHQFTSPPNLAISSPSSEEIIQEDKVTIVGKTDMGVTLTINNQAILTDNQGNFHQQVNLMPGLNTFEVKAINQLKKENVKMVKVLAEF